MSRATGSQKEAQVQVRAKNAVISVRFDQRDREWLEDRASAIRRETGRNATVSDIVRQAVYAVAGQLEVQR